jgi:hypothetical protein
VVQAIDCYIATPGGYLGLGEYAQRPRPCKHESRGVVSILRVRGRWHHRPEQRGTVWLLLAKAPRFGATRQLQTIRFAQRSAACSAAASPGREKICKRRWMRQAGRITAKHRVDMYWHRHRAIRAPCVSRDARCRYSVFLASAAGKISIIRNTILRGARKDPEHRSQRTQLRCGTGSGRHRVSTCCATQP